MIGEIRAAAPLMRDLAVPPTASGPWLTVVLNAMQRSTWSVPVPRVRPRAVVVDQHRQGRPVGAVLLTSRLRGPVTVVRLLGDGVGPEPPGLPPRRLYARDDEAAAALAEGVVAVLCGLRRPWRLELSGLPLGDPVLARLGALLPDAQFSTERTRRLVDDLDGLAGPGRATSVHRSTDPADLERWLPAVLARVPGDPGFLRAAARLHAATGQLEHAVVTEGGRVRAVLLTLLDGGRRWPWWGSSDAGGLPTERGAPLVRLTCSSGSLVSR